MIVLRILVCLGSWLSVVLGGQIMGGDPYIDFSNAQMMSIIGVKFRLSQKLMRTDYLQIVFPFPLHNFLTAAFPAPGSLSRPRKLIAKWGKLLEDESALVEENPTKIFTQTVDSAIYFLQFLNPDDTIYEVDPQWHQLKFYIRDKQALKYQKAGEVLQISIYSVSSIDDNAILYDDNQAFSFIFLNTAPPSSLVLDVFFDDNTNKNKHDKLNTVYFDTTIQYDLTKELDERVRLLYLISQEDFIFVQECFTATKFDDPKINALPLSDYTCKIDTINNRVELEVSREKLMAQSKIRLQVYIKNPNFVVPHADIEVRLLRKNSPQILANKVAQNVLEIVPINVLTHQLYMAWGVRPDPNLPFPLQIVRGNFEENLMPFNSIKVVFTLESSTPDNVELKVDIHLKADFDARILEGSISENLPPAPNKSVNCFELNSENPSKRRISCFGVGKMQEKIKYHIAFQIYFPKDIYEPNIPTATFGALTIETVQKVKRFDNVFIAGRSRDFMNHLLQTYPYASVVDRDEKTFLTYLQSFNDIYLLGHSKDFQDYPSEALPTTRPRSYPNKMVGFEDWFAPGNSLEFLDYLARFQDLFIIALAMREDLDYVKAVDPNIIVLQNVPKNIANLESVNGQSWMPKATSYGAVWVQDDQFNNAIISSQLTANPISQPVCTSQVTCAYDHGIKITPAEQRITFSTYGRYSDIQQPEDIADTPIPSSAGILFLFNPQFVPSPGSQAKWEDNTGKMHQSVDIKISQEVGATVYNEYTHVRISAANSDGLLPSFQTNIRQNNFWALRPFIVNQFSSQLVDENVFDFYIQTIDKINGPSYLQKVNSYILINAFSVDISVLPLVGVSISNFWTSNNNNYDGRYTPTIIRVQGQVDSLEQTDVKRIVVFFDTLQLFYRNQFSNEINCGSSNPETEVSCIGFETKKQNQNPNYYLTLSRVEIELKNAYQNFEVIFPVKTVVNVKFLKVYLGVMKPHPTYDYQTKSWGILNRVKQRVLFGFTSSYTGSIPIPFSIPNIDVPSFQYGLKADSSTDYKVGKYFQTGIPINAGHKDLGAVPAQVIKQNSATQFGAAFTYVANFKFFSDTSVITWLMTDAANPCIQFQYVYYFVDPQPSELHKVQNRYGIYCPYTTFIDFVDETAEMKLTKVTLPYFSGLDIFGYGGYSHRNGNLGTLSRNSFSIRSPQLLTNVVTSKTGPGFQKATLQFKFTTPIVIDSDIIIQVTAADPLSFTTTVISECSLRAASLYVTDGYDSVTKAHQCSVSMPDTKNILFQITKLKGKYEPGTNLILYHYGVDSSTGGVSTQFDLFIKYAQNNLPTDIMAQTSSQVDLVYDSTISGSQLDLRDFSADTQNQNSQSIFLFKFAIQNRQIWKGERINLNLGQFALENYFNVASLKCIVLEKDMTPSHIWDLIALNQLNDVLLKSKSHIFSSEPEYFIKCYQFKNPTSTNPTAISADLESSSGVSILSSNALAIPSFQDDQPNQFENSMIQRFVSPGSNTELIFKLKIGSIDINSKSRIIVMFPFYYTPKLSRDGVVRCYVGDATVNCEITKERILQVRHFKEQVPAATQIKLTIVGVTQPYTYVSSNFFLAYDIDYDDAAFNQFGEIIDVQLTQDLSKSLSSYIDILKFEISSSYLRDDSVTYVFHTYLDTGAKQILYGQTIMINFPPIYDSILRNSLLPQCTINKDGNTAQNYAGACQISGLQIQLYINEDMVTGSAYQIKLENLRNPDKYDNSFYQWIIQVADIDSRTLYSRSFASTSNYFMQNFQQKFNTTYLNYYDAEGKIVNEIKMIRGVRSDYIFVNRDDPLTFVFARSFILTTAIDEVFSAPSDVEVVVGTVSRRLQVYSKTALGLYEFNMKKLGDGNYYANLPMLRLLFGDQNLQPFQLKFSIYDIYYTAQESEILIDLNCRTPVEFLNITFTIPDGSENIGLEIAQNMASINITSQVPRGILQVVTKQRDLFVPGKSIQLQYNLYGPNAESYQLPPENQIELQIISEPDAENVVTVTPTQTLPSYNYHDFTISCGHKGNFYYHISRFYPEDKSFCSLDQQQIKNGTWATFVKRSELQEKLYECEDQFGVIYIAIPGSDYQIRVDELQSKQNYRLRGFCQSQRGDETAISDVSFITDNNGGRLYKLAIDFQYQPKSQQKVKLACFLSMYFMTHPQYVSTMQGEYCNEITYQRMLKELNDHKYAAVGEEFSYLNYFSRMIENSQKKRRVVQTNVTESSNTTSGDTNTTTSGNTTTSANSTNTTTNSTVQSDFKYHVLPDGTNYPDAKKCEASLLVDKFAKVFQVVYYFGRNQVVEQDLLPAVIENVTARGCLKPYINQNVVGLPKVINIHAAQVIEELPPPYQQPESIKLYQGFSWMFLDNIQLLQNGIIYMILDRRWKPNENNIIPTPSPTQMQFGYTQDGEAALSVVQLIYEIDKTFEFNFSFYPLRPKNQFSIFYVVANQDPFDSVTYDQVKVIQGSTQIAYQMTAPEFLRNSLPLLLGLIMLVLYL